MNQQRHIDAAKILLSGFNDEFARTILARTLVLFEWRFWLGAGSICNINLLSGKFQISFDISAGCKMDDLTLQIGCSSA